MKDFFYFVMERQAIYYRKEILKNDWPWTNDLILQTYKFCNVKREHDRCTKYLMATIINNPAIDLVNKVFNILAFRRFNCEGFFEVIGGTLNYLNAEKDCKEAERCLDLHKAQGHNLFNSAYVLCQVPFDRTYRPKDKHAQHLLLLGQNGSIASSIVLGNFKTIEELTEFLVRHLPLTGWFLAYQCALDISYLPEFKDKFLDINDWCHVGPGAEGTIDLIYGKQQNQFQYLQHCRILYQLQHQYLIEPLSLANIQNCCCEYRKYVNLKTNPKARKRYYKGAKHGL